MAKPCTPRARSTGIAAALLVLALPIAVTACGSDATTSSSGTSTPSSSSPADAALLDGTYTSIGVTGHDLVPGSTITVDFSGVELSFRAGCNHMSGRYVITDGVLSLTGDVASTVMGCAADLEAQDGWLSALLVAGAEVSETDTTLTLTGSGVTIELAAGTPVDGVERSGDVTSSSGTTP